MQGDTACGLEGQGALLAYRNGLVRCTPGQIPGLGLGQELEVFQLRQVGVVDNNRFGIVADVLGSVQGNVLPWTLP